jgi:hypothetical protein
MKYACSVIAVSADYQLEERTLDDAPQVGVRLGY